MATTTTTTTDNIDGHMLIATASVASKAAATLALVDTCSNVLQVYQCILLIIWLLLLLFQ